MALKLHSVWLRKGFLGYTSENWNLRNLVSSQNQRMTDFALKTTANNMYGRAHLPFLTSEKKIYKEAYTDKVIIDGKNVFLNREKRFGMMKKSEAKESHIVYADTDSFMIGGEVDPETIFSWVMSRFERDSSWIIFYPDEKLIVIYSTQEESKNNAIDLIVALYEDLQVRREVVEVLDNVPQMFL